MIEEAIVDHRQVKCEVFDLIEASDYQDNWFYKIFVFLLEQHHRVLQSQNRLYSSVETILDPFHQCMKNQFDGISHQSCILSTENKNIQIEIKKDKTFLQPIENREIHAMKFFDTLE